MGVYKCKVYKKGQHIKTGTERRNRLERRQCKLSKRI